MQQATGYFGGLALLKLAVNNTSSSGAGFARSESVNCHRSWFARRRVDRVPVMARRAFADATRHGMNEPGGNCER
jgi:hypothetical protein